MQHALDMLAPMNKSHYFFTKLSMALFCLLSACGGAGSATPAMPVTPTVTNLAAAITNFTVSSTSAAVQSSVPVTFGQPFKAGDLAVGTQLEARDEAGNSVPVQMDEVSSYADGSVRFAVLSAQLSNLQANEQRVVNLYRAKAASTTAVHGISTAAFDLKLTAIVYSPQISVITFGNRVGATAGTPYMEGEQITLQLGDTNPEQYVLTVTAAQAGGGFQTLTKIAEGFMTIINASSKNYLAYKPGGGGYENLWITPLKADGPPFGIKFTYAGTAVQTITQQQTYRAPRTYQANPRPVLDAMQAANRSPRLSGPVVQEYTVVTPFIDTHTNTPHPQLTARLHTRFVEAGSRVRTDMVIENNWTYAPSPGNITYALTVTQGGQTIYQQPAFTHNHHARWHKVLWSGGAEPQAQVRHNMRYFLDSKATWNYDLSVKIPESVLAAEAANLAKADTSPMGAAFITPYFPGTGARSDIGPVPRWTALYLLSQDPRQRAVMLANADAAASVPIHYRDAPTDQPVSLVAHPGLAMRFGTSNTADALPASTNDATNWVPDTNHQASFAYIPYMVTGDAFYLDETLFWANWNMGSKNPSYREFGKGLINSEEVRGQAWALRSIGEATRALPDKHPMKGYFKTKLADNLAWYNAAYPPRDPNNAYLSQIGMVERGTDQLNNSRPWMNDYMAIVLGQLAENGEAAALSYLQWLSNFTVGRFTHDNAGYCSANAPAYTLLLLDANGKQITDWGALYQKNWPSVASCDPNQAITMGYPELAIGYAATGRTMLAVSADLNIAGAASAYVNWKSRTPKMDKAFESDPTWAVVTRATQ